MHKIHTCRAYTSKFPCIGYKAVHETDAKAEEARRRRRARGGGRGGGEAVRRRRRVA